MKLSIDKSKFPIIIKSLIISLLYVGFGTVAVISDYPSSPLYGDWVLPVQILTLPVNVISGAITMTEYPIDYNLVLIVQFVVFLIFWYIIFKCMNSREIKIKSN
jgi:hypothetical protein